MVVILLFFILKVFWEKFGVCCFLGLIVIVICVMVVLVVEYFGIVYDFEVVIRGGVVLFNLFLFVLCDIDKI